MNLRKEYFLDSTKQQFLKIIKKFSDIEGLILGCFKLLLNTLKLHLEALVEFMLS